ncbi:DUF3187 domain-containing protein [Sulfurimonas sp. HSL3-7]|uniref:DUF3187 domain-containing protein n=1 Tax=Sulfonitrofixus jiaomeiensis TaxID=3131938 RepID=UPI0031F81C19
MKRLLFTLSLLPLSVFAYSDFDMDGVDDAIDRCPNTPLTELVDIYGCTTKNLEGDHHFDIIAGVSLSQFNENTLSALDPNDTDTVTTTLQADYYYKNFSLQASTSYFNSQSQSDSNSGQNDSFIGAYYQLYPVSSLNLQLGGGLLLPTYDTGYDNNNLDYIVSASLSYLFHNFNLFGGYNYTLINDDDFSYLDSNSDTVEIRYQNTQAFNAGIGFYPTEKLYTSVAYNRSDSIYQNVETIESASAYLFYSIDKHWFTTFSYAYGLSDSASDHYAAFRLGYYF